MEGRLDEPVDPESLDVFQVVFLWRDVPIPVEYDVRCKVELVGRSFNVEPYRIV